MSREYDRIAVMELTLDRVNELLDQAILERGADYVYVPPGFENRKAYEGSGFSRCMYVHEDADGEDCPGCIIGYVLHHAGVPLNELACYEGKGAATLLRSLRIDARYIVSDLLVKVQTRQDKGYTWGDAVAAAREEIADLTRTGYYEIADLLQ